MYYNISDKKLNSILEKENISFIDYYKKMYSEIDIIFENDSVFIFSPKTFESTQFFDNNINWCTCKSKEEFYRHKSISSLIRIHFKKERKMFKYTKFYNERNFGRSRFSDFHGKYYDDKYFVKKFPTESEIIKRKLPLINKFIKNKMEEWFCSEKALTIFNLHLNYSLKTYKNKKRLADKLSNYKKLNIDIINSLSMVSNFNTNEDFLEFLNIASDKNEFKVMDTYILVSSYNDRLSNYNKEDLIFDIKEWNKKYN